MGAKTKGKMFRIYGEDAVLTRLDRLGANPRTFDNLVSVGFPPQQLEEARSWYREEAISHVQHYAAQRMETGFFEDEPLLEILCRFFQCTDWKLEKSPWFLSLDDYNKFNRTLLDPVKFHVHQVNTGVGEARWGNFFLKLPFDLGMERALRSLWEEIIHGEYYWDRRQSYIHLRSANLLKYLERTVDIMRFSEHQFNYNWEKRFRRLFKPELVEFRDALERAVRNWEERRREKTRRFSYGPFNGIAGMRHSELLLAFKYFDLEPATANQSELNKSYRRLSKQYHPDQGGSDEDFKRLSTYKELVESWLQDHHPA